MRLAISRKKKRRKGAKEIKGVEVKVCSPVKRNMFDYIELNATTSYQKQEIVRATFQGFIEKSFKNVGDLVTKGDLLYLVRTKEAAAADSIYSQFNKNKFEGFVKIFAKTSGTLTELNHQSGDYVVDGDQLLVIVDTKSVQIVLNAPFEDVKFIKPSASYQVLLPDHRTISAKVTKKVPSMDIQNQIQTFVLIPEQNGDLPSNLNVLVKIPVQSVNNAFTLPKSAIMTDETQKEFWVMKLAGDSLAVKVTIEKGITNDSLVQIIKPVFDLKDSFISEGAFGLPDTAKIIIKK